MNTDTLLDYLVVLAVAALLLGPTLYGIVHDRRIVRQLSAAARTGTQPRRAAAGPRRSGVRPASRSATWRRGSVAH